MTSLVLTRLDWRPCTLEDVEALLAIEQRVYSHPWTHGNFVDSIAGGHWAWLAQEPGQATVQVYWLAMPVLEELHLLNLAVHPAHQRRGLARQALAHLMQTAHAQGLREVWLEVRESNQRAQALYAAAGFDTVGRRRGYYPLDAQQREDALLMRRALDGRGA